MLASSLAGLPSPIDGVTPEFTDHMRLKADVARSLRFGFSGKLCIHPAQVAVVHRAMAPTNAQLAWAERIIGADEGSLGGAVQLDGRMVDAPVVKAARRLLARRP
jgi:citrate lyase subunit beta/citryl-CoA lyase